MAYLEKKTGEGKREKIEPSKVSGAVVSERGGYTSGGGSAPGGNTFVQNIGLDPLVNFNFMLRVEGVMDIPCKSVSAFTKENEYEYIKEGGLNDYVHMKRKPISKPFTFTVERYITPSYMVDPLALGAELFLPVLLFVSRYGNDFRIIARTYTFTGCTVISKEFGSLNAEKSGLLTESVTIAYREMLVFDLPAGSSAPEFKFSASATDRSKVSGKSLYNKSEKRKTDKNTSEYFKFEKNPTSFRGMNTYYQTQTPAASETTDETTTEEQYSFPKTKEAFRYNAEPGKTAPTGGVAGRAKLYSGEIRKNKMAQDAKFVDHYNIVQGTGADAKVNKTRLRAREAPKTGETPSFAEKYNIVEGTGADAKVNKTRLRAKKAPKTGEAAVKRDSYKFSATGTFIKGDNAGTGNAVGSVTAGVVGNARTNSAEVRKSQMAEKADYVAHYEIVKATGQNKGVNKTRLRAKAAPKTDEASVKRKNYAFSASGTYIRSNESEKGGVAGNARTNGAEIRKTNMGTATFAAKYGFLKDNKPNTQRVRAKEAPNDKPRPEPRIWQPVKK